MKFFIAISLLLNNIIQDPSPRKYLTNYVKQSKFRKTPSNTLNTLFIYYNLGP